MLLILTGMHVLLSTKTGETRMIPRHPPQTSQFIERMRQSLRDDMRQGWQSTTRPFPRQHIHATAGKLFWAFLCTCTLLALAVFVPVMAQIPSGSYQQSCRDIAQRGPALEAVCRRINGSDVGTRLEDFRSCVDDIANIDGSLTCTKSEIPPSGSYRGSCDDYWLEGARLHAHCGTRDGNFIFSALQDYQVCTSDIWNSDGNLRCNRGGEPPGGSYQASCDDFWVEGNTLFARCATRGGQSLRTQLGEFNSCISDIRNIDGNLQCKRSGEPPDAPLAPTFTDVTETSITIWRPYLPDGATSLTLEQRQSDGSYKTETKNPGPDYTKSTLNPSTTYTFRFIAVGPVGQTPGPQASVTTKASPPPPTVVPNIVRLFSNQAVEVLEAAHLKQGFVYNPTGEYRSDRLRVVRQAPVAGEIVDRNSAVDYRVELATQQRGVKQISLYNCNDSRRAVNIWVYDISAGIRQEKGQITAQWNGTCPAPGATPLQVKFESNHSYLLVAVDVGNINCGRNDPEIINCRRLEMTILGDSSGEILNQVIP